MSQAIKLVPESAYTRLAELREIVSQREAGLESAFFQTIREMRNLGKVQTQEIKRLAYLFREVMRSGSKK